MRLLISLFFVAFAALAAKQLKSSCADESQLMIYNASLGREQKVDRLVRTDDEWGKVLTQEQYCILRERGTEAPFSDPNGKGKTDGVYKCVGCGTDLFYFSDKFDDGYGWPCFKKPVSVKHGQP